VIAGAPAGRFCRSPLLLGPSPTRTYVRERGKVRLDRSETIGVGSGGVLGRVWSVDSQDSSWVIAEL
jgi:hypothetical protein